MRLSLNGEWKLRYHLEEKNMPEASAWPEIPAQVKELARSMETTLDDVGFDYESGTEWSKDK